MIFMKMLFRMTRLWRRIAKRTTRNQMQFPATQGATTTPSNHGLALGRESDRKSEAELLMLYEHCNFFDCDVDSLKKKPEPVYLRVVK